MDGDGEGACAEGEGACAEAVGEGVIETAEFDREGGVEEGDGEIGAELVGDGDWAPMEDEVGEGVETTDGEVSGEGETDCARALVKRKARIRKLAVEFIVAERVLRG